MARGQEGFNKRENEKKRQKKRQEKEGRKEERQANAKKGQNLEDMLAYVDEFGNITSTPPDPNKKREEISLDDIQLGARRRDDDGDQGSSVRTGLITNFNTAKGYGFIKDLQSQESIFVHVNELIDKVREGDKVTFEVTRGPKGLNAVAVRRATEAQPGASPATPE
ncbi:cold-shock protein [Hymenobacter sp. CRA2]|uniref:cold-shock protein n=1 Tax=Hymenobacter sp. CRA2 TaxID=1955620 RepID=UPI00098FD4EB|nr:cold shock domain-containing protein [Hymenobacter sp. CRA2]OON67889.1 DNA-binding protein [Hymenobacter sp. CRA2]